MFINQANLKGWTATEKSNFLGGLPTLVIREHSLGSVMALYYAQYKHTKFGWGSCLGIN